MQRPGLAGLEHPSRSESQSPSTPLSARRLNASHWHGVAAPSYPSQGASEASSSAPSRSAPAVTVRHGRGPHWAVSDAVSLWRSCFPARVSLCAVSLHYTVSLWRSDRREITDVLKNPCSRQTRLFPDVPAGETTSRSPARRDYFLMSRQARLSPDVPEITAVLKKKQMAAIRGSRHTTHPGPRGAPPSPDPRHSLFALAVGR